jgi:hypothetical protein
LDLVLLLNEEFEGAVWHIAAKHRYNCPICDSIVHCHHYPCSGICDFEHGEWLKMDDYRVSKAVMRTLVLDYVWDMEIPMDELFEFSETSEEPLYEGILRGLEKVRRSLD